MAVSSTGGLHFALTTGWAKGPVHTSQGQRPRHWHTQTLSAKGAIHPCGIVRDGVMNDAWRWDEPGFQPFLCLPCITWGVAPDWFENAPLALTEAATQRGSGIVDCCSLTASARAGRQADSTTS